LLNKKRKESLLGYKPLSARVMLARFAGTSQNLFIIQVYAPMAAVNELGNGLLSEKGPDKETRFSTHLERVIDANKDLL